MYYHKSLIALVKGIISTPVSDTELCSISRSFKNLIQAMLPGERQYSNRQNPSGKSLEIKHLIQLYKSKKGEFKPQDGNWRFEYQIKYH